ncbi:MAG: hypothetical protein GTO45_20160 [Candidatus Aminicenantes bacterium]|nr:hypothetical protein [Candidatus Aminicenantes bacterium]NIM81111.1 hypothetical protein [Candidatus Aminicenantes bacterium]NIN20485.1 hypothetical protein [Candidatus Aminicenantes bacterium]NIN44258.1 hypothetical protein [Candidatus Aminicenantes bacterium]NIN87077.1 hypothetical protein [Candidatus Aminicenantes bacterium]
MKTKTMSRKLVLKRTTVSNLTKKDLNAVKGGLVTRSRIPGPCPSCDGKTC